MAPAARTRSAKAEVTHAEPALSAGDIRRRASSGAALLTAKGIFVQVLGLLSTIVVARLLLPNQLGLYAIAVTISTFLLMLGSGVGMGAALIRRPAAPEHAYLRAFVALQLIVSSVLLGVVILATRPFGLVGQLTAVMVVSAPITAFGGASLVVAERQLLYKRIASAETAAMVVFYVWTVVTVVIGWGLWGLATATVARSIVGTALIIALAPTGVVWPRYDRRRIRAMLEIGLRVQAVDFVVAFRDQILVLGTAAIGSCLHRRLLEPHPASAPGAPDALVESVARFLSSDVSDQVRRRGSRQHAATAPGCRNDPHRHATRAAGGGTGPRTAPVWRQVVACG